MRSSRAVRALLTGLALGAIFLFTATLWHYGKDGPLTNAIDFRAFYCAGAALDAGGDPYRVEPVRSCERATLALAGFSFAQKDVFTAPFPPYVLGLFALFARLPYRAAVELWLTIGIAALCVAIFATSRIASMRPLYVMLALVFAAGFASFFFGQPVPIFIAALSLGAIGARTGRGALVCAALVVASIEPHLALPAWLGAAFFVPAARRPLAIAAIVIGVSSLIFAYGLSHEYATAILPAHARSEVMNFADQYGLSALLRQVGTPVSLALILGSVSYAVMVSFGLWIGRTLSQRCCDDAFNVLTPVAFATFGGPFLHGHQVAAALPFALLLFSKQHGQVHFGRRVLLGIAIVALAIPWQIVADEPGVNAMFPTRLVPKTAPLRVPDGNELIERSYTERMDALATQNERTVAVQFAWKLPTWLALATLLSIAFVSSAKPRALGA